jgi:hypothetical protein
MSGLMPALYSFLRRCLAPKHSGWSWGPHALLEPACALLKIPAVHPLHTVKRYMVVDRRLLCCSFQATSSLLDPLIVRTGALSFHVDEVLQPPSPWGLSARIR